MNNDIFPDDNIQNSEDPMPESVKNFFAIQAVREITGEDEEDGKEEII